MDPFTVPARGAADADPVHACLRAAGPLARVDAPAGGPAWIVTDVELARAVLGDPRIVKDPAWAPTSWGPDAGLEAPAAAVPSLTTADGPAHDVLRRAHVPLFTASRMQAHAARSREIARTLLDDLADLGDEADLMADFTTRYPLTVLFELLGVPMHLLDPAADACRAMLRADMSAIGTIVGIASTALDGDGIAADLRRRLPELTDDELCYLLFGLIFAGQLTTDTVLGFVVAHALHDEPGSADALVHDVLRRHPPAPFTLWRFTACDVELAGVALPARTPLLVDIAGINASLPGGGPDLTFGAGPHFCIGAQLARVELVAVVETLRADFPAARLAVPFDALRQAGVGAGIQQGARLEELPVRLR